MFLQSTITIVLATLAQLISGLRLSGYHGYNHGAVITNSSGEFRAFYGIDSHGSAYHSKLRVHLEKRTNNLKISVTNGEVDLYRKGSVTPDLECTKDCQITAQLGDRLYMALKRSTVDKVKPSINDLKTHQKVPDCPAFHLEVSEELTSNPPTRPTRRAMGISGTHNNDPYRTDERTVGNSYHISVKGNDRPYVRLDSSVGHVEAELGRGAMVLALRPDRNVNDPVTILGAEPELALPPRKNHRIEGRIDAKASHRGFDVKSGDVFVSILPTGRTACDLESVAKILKTSSKDLRYLRERIDDALKGCVSADGSLAVAYSVAVVHDAHEE